MNLYQLENHRVKLISVDGKVYIGDVLSVQSPEDTPNNKICVNIEVKDKYGLYTIWGIYEDEIQSVEDLGW